jgi:hypothetical protein
VLGLQLAFFFFFSFFFAFLRTVRVRKWHYFHYEVLSPGAEATFYMHETDKGSVHDCDLYLQVDSFPTKRNYFLKETRGVGRDATLVINSTAPRGTWFAGIYMDFLSCNYELTFTLQEFMDFWAVIMN